MHAEICVVLLSGLLDHGSNVRIVLPVALEMLDHCLLRRQLGLINSCNRTVDLRILHGGDEFHGAGFRCINELGSDLYGVSSRGDESQVQNVRSEDLHARFGTSVANDSQQTSLRLIELLVAAVHHGFALFIGGEYLDEFEPLVGHAAQLDVERRHHPFKVNLAANWDVVDKL